MNKTVWLDTDIGDDIDDSYALALIMGMEDVTLKGISTVYRNVEQRSHIAANMVSAFSRYEIPVYAGLDFPEKEPIKKLPYETFLPDGRPNIAHYSEDMARYAYSEEHALDALERALKEDGALVLIAIGPLTNVAALVTRSPDILKGRDVIIMGGTTSPSFPEWNIACDPEAARTVFNAGANIRLIGLNVTKQCVLWGKDLEFFRALSSEYGLLQRMTEIWIKNIEGKTNPIMHDPLAASVLTQNFCSFIEKYVYVPLEKHEGKARGYTWFFDERVPGSSKVKVATGVNRNGFIEFLKETVGKLK